MTPVLLSNPGLPLAIYGNPGKRKRSRSRSRRKNPVFLGPKAGMWATNPPRRSLASRFPGWRIVSVRSIGKKTRKNPSRARARRRTRKNPMAKAVRSKRTGRFLSHRTKRFQGRRARYTVGRQYRSRKGWVRVFKAHIRKKAGKRRSHPAVKWSGRKGKIAYSGIGTRKGRKGIRAVRFTNPRGRGRRSRRNPGVLKGYVSGLTGAPNDVMSTFKNFNLKKGLTLAGGTVGAYVLGGIASTFVGPLLEKIPGFEAGKLPLVKRVIGAAFPYTVAFVAAQAGLLGKYKSAALLGGAVASIVELLFPGKVGELIRRVPGLDRLPGISTISGLGGLDGSVAGIDALAGYVQAPSYAGVGNDELAGYVQAPSYAGVGGLGYLNDSDAMVSYLAPSQQ